MDGFIARVMIGAARGPNTTLSYAMDIRAERSRRVGSAIYGLGLIGFGWVALAHLDALPALEPISTSFPLRPLLGVVTAIVLIGCGALLVTKRQALQAAVSAGAFFAFLLVSLHIPNLAAHPLSGGAWVVAFEVVAISSAAWMLSAALMLDGAADSRQRTVWRRVGVVARQAFAISLLAFGASHFIYHQYVESVIPAWIPAHRFWAYAVGIAFLAAGAAISTGIKARLAATLLAVMFGSWVLLVHSPRVVTHSPNANEWTSLLVAVAMCGGSWLVGVCFAQLDQAVEDAGVASRGVRAKGRQLASL
ncbi:MAG: hypothetical protein ABJF01_05500 [bacterium]